MTMQFENCDLFDFRDTHYLAHCISADYRLGAGIAKQFDMRYNIRASLFDDGTCDYPDCILTDRIFNLVTKRHYYDKPTYNSLQDSLYMMRDIVYNRGVKKIAIPKIGCGLDKLEWDKVERVIKQVFDEYDIEIVVCTPCE